MMRPHTTAVDAVVTLRLSSTDGAAVPTQLERHVPRGPATLRRAVPACISTWEKRNASARWPSVGWHNNHHAHQRWEWQGLKWWESDGSCLTIRTLQRLGLTWGLVGEKGNDHDRRAVRSGLGAGQ